MGGIGVEIYKDTTLRMAPLQEKDIIPPSLQKSEGFRAKATKVLTWRP
jgi:hypothetical protein